jgi:tetratricopeptide (TPR) repeat protein
VRTHRCSSGSAAILALTLAASAALAATAEETYQQLAALETERAGDVQYDYQLGSAALDAGHSSAAVFALQRAVSSAPGFSGARFELARAYYGTGDYEAARREFEILKGEQPPPAVADAIQQYLDAIDRRAGAYQPQFSALLEAGGGYDSNANGASDVNDFLGFELNDRSRSQSSAYYGASVAGQMSYPLVPRWRVLGDASAQQRNYPGASFVDATVARLGTGVERAHEDLTIAAGVSGTYVALEGERNNINAALDLSAVHAFAVDWQLGLSARAAALRFASELSAQDVDSFLGSVALTRSFESRPRLQLAASFTGGHERAREEQSPFGRNLVGGRLSAFLSPKSTILGSVSVAVLRSDYRDAFFVTILQDGTTSAEYRDDTQYSARLAFDWKDFPARYWSIGTQVTYINNRSSLSLFEYDRVDASLMLRREFR